MGWRTTGDVAEFLEAAGDYLRLERAKNTVLLTVTEQMRVNPARYSGSATVTPVGNAVGSAEPDEVSGPLFGWWTSPGGGPANPASLANPDSPANLAGPASTVGRTGADRPVGGAFLHTPPFPLVLTDVPAAIAADLAATLASRPLRAVNAVPEAAAAFSATWRDARRGRGSATVHRRMRLYRLAELASPDPAPDGAPRVATDADAPLLTDWFTAFAGEAHDLDDGEDHAADVRDRLGYGGVLVWEAGGAPVSIAGLSRQVAGMIRVGPVYTPPQLRGHGYGSAVTAAVSRRARDAGAEEVLLYTDLANPVSNSIYQRIGYRGVEDRVLLAFPAAQLPAGNVAFPG